MILYPEAMCTAQAEIDAVVGRDRTPTFEDIDSLPYIQAVIKEVLRWRPVSPNGRLSVSSSLICSDFCLRRAALHDRSKLILHIEITLYVDSSS